MGWLDRVHSLVTATGGALEAPLGFVKDTAEALPELGSLNLPDFTHDVYHAMLDAGGKEITSLVGPQGIGGTLVGGLPSSVRSSADQVLQPVEGTMDLAYHDLIGKPLSSAVTAATVGKQDGIGAIFQPQTWAESWNIAEHRSPGQSLALAFLTKDIFNPAQVKKAQATDWYNVISGVTDAVARVELDPTALALGAATDALKASRAIDTAGDITRLTAGGQVGKFADAVDGLVAQHGDGAAAAIRHTFFPDHPLGAHIADVLANADKLPAGLVDGLSGGAARERVTRILMGSGDEIEALRATRPDLAGQIERLAERKSSLMALSLNGEALATTPEEIANTSRELNALYVQRDRLDRLDQLTAYNEANGLGAGAVSSLPRPGGAVALRGRFTLGDFYQNSIFAKPLHVLTQMEPAPWIHLDDPRSDITIARMLEESSLPLEQRLALRSEYMAANSPAQRLVAATKAENAAVGSIATEAGMSPDELHAVLAEASRGRGLAKGALDSRAYDGVGRSKVVVEGENGITHELNMIDAPLYETQLPNLAPVVDMNRVKAAVSPIKRFLARNPGYQVAQELLDNFASVWKPAVLLRVGFPVRFVTDEAMRSMSKIGVLATTKNLFTGGGDAASSVLHKIGVEPGELHGFEIAGHQFEGAFGAPGDGASLYRKLIEARDAFGTLVSEGEGKTLDQMIASGPWRSVQPTEAAYPAAWEHAVNNQIGKSELGSKMLYEQMHRITPRDELALEGISTQYIRGDTVNAAGEALLEHDPELIAKAHDLIDQSIEHRLSSAILEHDATSNDVGATLRNIEAGASPSSLGVEGHMAVHQEAERALDRMFYDASVEAHGQYFAQLPPRTREQIVGRVTAWLRDDPQGQELARKLPIRTDLEGWAGAAYDQIDAYLPTDELKAGAWAGTVTHDELAAHLPNAADRPIVHGGVVAEQMGGPIGRMYRGFVDSAMRNLVGKPSNVLIRNPFFDHMYQAELSRQVTLLTGEEQASLPNRLRAFLGGASTHAEGNALDLSAEDMRRMELRARRYALGQTKDLFHNFAEEFHFSKQLGQLAPFANAWGQVMSRWAGVAIDNPAFVRRLQVIWRAPERAGLVTDGAGNVLDVHGRIATPINAEQYKVGGPAADGQRNVTLHLPAWAHDIPGLKNVGDFEFGKSSLNLILHGLPSVGPLVQVGVNEIAKARPDLESSLKWALPYGVTPNTLDILKPTIIRRLQTQSEGDANRSYAYTAMRIYTDKMVDYNLGKTPARPTWADAEKDANAFWHMRTIASYVLPVTPQFTSPYQPYLDAYRARKDLDGSLTPAQRALPSYKTPDEWFLDTYGNEFFPLVASMSKSIDGIAPTLAGQQIHDEFGKLIESYPELGSLIQGEEGSGAFSRAVYEAQFGQKVGPGSSDKERTVQPFDEFRNQSSTKLGWIEFGRVMDALDALRVQRGLPSFNVKAASDLARAKQALVGYLANSPKYAGWYDDYAASDSAKWDHRIQGMTAIVADKRLAERPEFQGLKKFLDGRKQIVAALEALGSKNLGTKANQALHDGWDAYVGQLVDQNPAFGALYNRWLQNDPVSISPITLAAQAGTLPQ